MVDKCRVNNGGCGRNARCTVHKSTGQVICKCHKGYINVGKGGRCDCRGMSPRYSDCGYKCFFIVDKCRVNNGGCGRNARCTVHKSTGRVICKCHKGYVNVGKGGRCDCRGMCPRYLQHTRDVVFDCR